MRQETLKINRCMLLVFLVAGFWIGAASALLAGTAKEALNMSEHDVRVGTVEAEAKDGSLVTKISLLDAPPKTTYDVYVAVDPSQGLGNADGTLTVGDDGTVNASFLEDVSDTSLSVKVVLEQDGSAEYETDEFTLTVD